MSEASLPPAYSALEPVARRWAKASEAERDRVRWAASAEEFRDLYDPVMPRLDAILAHLGTKPVEALDAGNRSLFYLACAFAEAAPHHELYGGSAEVPFSFAAERFVPAHGAQDSARPGV